MIRGKKKNENMTQKSKRILAVSSGGGHWIELVRLLPAFKGYDLSFVTVEPSYKPGIQSLTQCRFYCVKDVTRWNKAMWIYSALQILLIIIKERPGFIVSTGALPGYMAMRVGRLLGAKTIWVDSIANVEELSLSGQRIGKHADLWLTQWKHLAKDGGPHYRGAVL